MNTPEPVKRMVENARSKYQLQKASVGVDQSLVAWLTTAATTLYNDAVREEREKNIELAGALLMMYEQYCDKGHLFMSAGETASSVLEAQGYAVFDEAGRMELINHPDYAPPNQPTE